LLYLVNLHGQDCAISPRNPAVASKCVLTPAAKGGLRIIDRDNFWEGLIPSDKAVKSGETVSVSSRTVLVMSIIDDMRGITRFMGARINTILDWKRETPSVDANNNVNMTWSSISSGVQVFSQLITAELRQENPGLLPGIKYLVFIPSRYNIKQMDRVVFNGVSCRVDYADTIILDGINRLQCSEDTRI